MEGQLVKLNAGHKDQILKFWNSKRDLYGQEVQPNEAASLRKYQVIFEQKAHMYHLYGVLDSQDNVVFTLGTVLWDKLPYYSFIDFHSASSIRASNKIKEYMASAINQLLVDMLALKRHTFYYLFERAHVAPEVEWDPNHSHSYFKFIPESHKYDYLTELIIRPGERPEYLSYWKLMGERTHQVELVVRRGTLKPQHMRELLKA